MTDKVEIEIVIVMDEAGNYVVGADEDEASERFDEQVGGLVRRVVKIKAKMTPAIVDEAEIDIPDSAGTTEVEAA